jgi:hypothetical protein
MILSIETRETHMPVEHCYAFYTYVLRRRSRYPRELVHHAGFMEHNYMLLSLGTPVSWCTITCC